MDSRRLNFTLESVQDPDLNAIADLPSLERTKAELRRILERDPHDWNARNQLAFLISRERTSIAKRFAFNFPGALELIRQGLLMDFGPDTVDRIEDHLTTRETELIVHPLAKATGFPGRESGFSLDHPGIRAIAAMRKQSATCRRIKKASRAGIPRGQVLTLPDGDFYYDDPLDAAWSFTTGVPVSNTSLLQLVSAMQAAVALGGGRFAPLHRVARVPEPVTPETGPSGVTLTLDSSFLDMDRFTQVSLLLDAVGECSAIGPDAPTEPAKSWGPVSLSGVRVPILDFNGLSLGPKVARDILLDCGADAWLSDTEKLLQRETCGPEREPTFVGVSLSDRRIESFLEFLLRFRAVHPDLPVVIGGPSVVQWRELTAVLPGDGFFLLGGDAEAVLPALAFSIAGIRRGEDVAGGLARMRGLVYRLSNQAGFIRPESPAEAKSYPLHLPSEDGAGFDWNPNRGCPKRCAYCNNVQGVWRHASFTSMQAHLLAIAGVVAEARPEFLVRAGHVLNHSLDPSDPLLGLPVRAWPVEVLDGLGKLHQRPKEAEQALNPLRRGKELSRVATAKAVRVLNGLAALAEPGRPRLEPFESRRVTVFTASDNFLADRAPADRFYSWLTSTGLSKYFNFRTQTSLDFLWNRAKGEPDQGLIERMRTAGINSLGFGYDSSSNGIGTDVLKNNSYSMMAQIFDTLVSAGYDRNLLRVHHFYSSPLSDFGKTLEGLLLREANATNELGNKIAMVLYTYRSELGMLCRMGLAPSGRREFRHVSSGHPAYTFLHSEASFLPMLDPRAEAFLKSLFRFDESSQEFEPSYDPTWLFADRFRPEIEEILARWSAPSQSDPEIHSLGLLVTAVLRARPGAGLMGVFAAVKSLMLRRNIYSFVRLTAERGMEPLVRELLACL